MERASQSSGSAQTGALQIGTPPEDSEEEASGEESEEDSEEDSEEEPEDEANLTVIQLRERLQKLRLSTTGLKGRSRKASEGRGTSAYRKR